MDKKRNAILDLDKLVGMTVDLINKKIAAESVPMNTNTKDFAGLCEKAHENARLMEAVCRYNKSIGEALGIAQEGEQ